MLPDAVRRVVEQLARLPGVGEKTATRYALALLAKDPTVSQTLGQALLDLSSKTHPCARCGFPAEGELCLVCEDGRRDVKVLCVVGRIQDMMSLERSGAMRGRYFVLPRLLSPLEGVGPEDLPVDALRARVREGVEEVIVATPSTVEGEATALFLSRELAPLGVRVTRLASGVPHGGDLEYADPITLGRALEGRRSLG